MTREQLRAEAAGGRVTAARAPEIGLTPMRMTDAAAEDPVLGALPPEVAALQWHFLEVAQLPPGSVALCESDRCANQAFRVGPRAWGVQFHLEGLTETAAQWARDDSEGLKAAQLTRTEVIEQMRRAEDDLRARWSAVADRWIATASAHATAPTAAQTSR